MKFAFALLFSCFSLSASSQKDFKKVITGELNRSIFSTDEELKQWFPKEYSKYKPKASSVKNLQKQLEGKKIVVVLGTWCSDTQELFPQLLKILDLIGFPKNALVIYGMDKGKTTPADIIARYKIEKVPTFIVFNNAGKETGRIIETVDDSVEEDLEAILK